MFGIESNKVNTDLIKKCINTAKNIKMAGLLKKLILRGCIESEKVCNALLEVDRGDFVDPSSDFAYVDS